MGTIIVTTTSTRVALVLLKKDFVHCLVCLHCVKGKHGNTRVLFNRTTGFYHALFPFDQDIPGFVKRLPFRFSWGSIDRTTLNRTTRQKMEPQQLELLREQPMGEGLLIAMRDEYL